MSNDQRTQRQRWTAFSSKNEPLRFLNVPINLGIYNFVIVIRGIGFLTIYCTNSFSIHRRCTRDSVSNCRRVTRAPISPARRAIWNKSDSSRECCSFCACPSLDLYGSLLVAQPSPAGIRTGCSTRNNRQRRSYRFERTRYFRAINCAIRPMRTDSSPIGPRIQPYSTNRKSKRAYGFAAVETRLRFFSFFFPRNSAIGRTIIGTRPRERFTILGRFSRGR